MLVIDPGKRKTSKQVLDFLRNPFPRPKAVRGRKKKGKKGLGQAKPDVRYIRTKLSHPTHDFYRQSTCRIFILALFTVSVASTTWIYRLSYHAS